MFGPRQFKSVVDRPRVSPAAPSDESLLPPITMYTTQWCGACLMAKRHLRRRGIPYIEIDIEKVAGAADQVKHWARGYRTVPTFVIGERIVVDWDQSAFEAALSAEIEARREAAGR